MMKRMMFASVLLAMAPAVTLAQAPNPAQEGGPATQTLVRVDSKHNVVPTAATTTVQVNGHAVPLAGFSPVQPGNAEVALLIDEGLSRSAGIQLSDLRKFATSLPPQTSLFVGYMSNGRVLQAVPFTTDHARAAKAIRLPDSLPGQSASPYFCLSDFVKHWPTGEQTLNLTRPLPAGSPLKARFVIMVTDGVDPYNGSVSIVNQNSPYVEAAANDAQRAGVPVYSVYYSDAALRGGAAAFSGQSYLQQVGDETGGQSLYLGTINPVSLTPYFDEFRHAMGQTYIATFSTGPEARAHNGLVQLKISSSEKGLKLRHATAVMPGTLESTVQQ